MAKIKNLADLRKIKESALEQMAVRGHGGTRAAEHVKPDAGSAPRAVNIRTV